MKIKTLILPSLALGAVLALAGCGAGEEPYVIEGPGADHPSVAGTQSSDGSAGSTVDSKPQKAPPKSRDGR